MRGRSRAARGLVHWGRGHRVGRTSGGASLDPRTAGEGRDGRGTNPMEKGNVKERGLSLNTVRIGYPEPSKEKSKQAGRGEDIKGKKVVVRGRHQKKCHS